MKLTPTLGLLAALILIGMMPLAFAHDTGHMGDIDRVNGDIEIGDNSSAGNLDTVNGDIEVGSGSQVGTTETVNGDIELAAGVSAQSAETVNGSIKGRGNNVIAGGVETVNGEISFNNGAQIGRNVKTVNGDIELTDVHVAHGIETVSGDIRLKGRSKIVGTLAVRKPHGTHFCLFSCSDKDKPELIIEAGVEVASIVLEREVRLEIDPAAIVGKIEKRYEKK